MKLKAEVVAQRHLLRQTLTDEERETLSEDQKL